MKKRELEKIWKLLDGACDALDRMTYDEETLQLLKAYRKYIDFSCNCRFKK